MTGMSSMTGMTGMTGMIPTIAMVRWIDEVRRRHADDAWRAPAQPEGPCWQGLVRGATAGVLPSDAVATPRPGPVAWISSTSRLMSTAMLVACAPEPASSVEIGQTVAEVVDLARAMALEHAIVDLTIGSDVDADPEELAAIARESAALTFPYSLVTAEGSAGLAVDLGPPGGECPPGERCFTGAVELTFSAPSPGARLAVITYHDLAGAGGTLTGRTEVSFTAASQANADGTRRLVSELRLTAVDERQLEIQSDRVQRTYRGALQIDGHHRWQTLMGRWEMELAGWELVRGEPVPGRGLARVSTPFEHEVVLDFVGAGADGMLMRANGGRRDRVFSVAMDGAVVDLGDD
jgi:hypothetical protein